VLHGHLRHDAFPRLHDGADRAVLVRALGFVAVLAGCNFANSNTVATDDVRADLQVIADGTGQTQVLAWLWTHRAGDPPLNQDSIELVDGDQLTAMSGGQTIAMQETDLVAEYRYDATFDSDVAGQSFTIALDRTSDASAPASTVMLADPFTMSAPDSFSRGQPLPLAWSPSGAPSDLITASFAGSCASGQIGPVPDTGSLTIAAAALSSQDQSTCNVTLELTRTHPGVLDAGYGQGGSIVSMQQRSMTLVSTP
jgi:hypothetical protein